MRKLSHKEVKIHCPAQGMESSGLSPTDQSSCLSLSNQVACDMEGDSLKQDHLWDEGEKENHTARTQREWASGWICLN